MEVVMTRCPAVRLGLRRLALLASVLALTGVPGASAPLDAQTPASGSWEIPLTEFGRPDFQGNWTNSTLTPFQREEGRGPVYTWDEVREIEEPDGFCPPNPGTVECGRPERQGDSNEARLSGNEYNEVYWERGTVIARVYGEPRTSLVTVPADGRIPDRTPQALAMARREAAFEDQFGAYDHPELRPFAERCILFGSPSGPPMIPVGAYNSNYVITQTEDHLVIQSEMVHDVRIIRIGEPESVPSHVRPYFGYSWGHWEGDALVVETTNISPQQSIVGGPLSADAKVTERFSFMDPETILYEFTVDDPATFTGPWGGQIPISRLHAGVYEYACHEGNYSLSAVLSGARYEEGQAEGN